MIASKELGESVQELSISACLFSFFNIYIYTHTYIYTYTLTYITLIKNTIQMLYLPYWITVQYRWPSWQPRGAEGILWDKSESPSNTTWFSFSSLSPVQLFVTPWTAAHQASLSITNSRSLLKLMSIESMKSSNHLTLCRPRLQSIGVSASASIL